MTPYLDLGAIENAVLSIHAGESKKIILPDGTEIYAVGENVIRIDIKNN
jgi:hypothetical protein